MTACRGLLAGAGRVVGVLGAAAGARQAGGHNNAMASSAARQRSGGIVSARSAR
ncbi:hypothetical protein AACH06_00500 [Ideonella sp. DXS29W]|uniref:Uncharacterized protein n=1 Tax=Ideonella lacteola TaxID=2984193 RepID=A0ABU9BIE3_9BURK